MAPPGAVSSSRAAPATVAGSASSASVGAIRPQPVSLTAALDIVTEYNPDPADPEPPMRRTVVALAVLGGVAACSPPPLVPSPSSGQHSPGQPGATVRATVTTPAPAPKPTAPPAPRATVR